MVFIKSVCDKHLTHRAELLWHSFVVSAPFIQYFRIYVFTLSLSDV